MRNVRLTGEGRERIFDVPSHSYDRVPPAGRALVTGAAGFLGSHLCERLVASGHEVVGVDCFTDFYSRELKEDNLRALRDEPSFKLLELDLSCDDLGGLLEGVDVVFHLAAQAGVRSSFGESFQAYLHNNIRATQRLLEAAVEHPPVSFTYASSSSVYGNAAHYPTNEQTTRQPVSPYGMTKASTEDLAAVYHRCYGLPVVGLRYFTAYGPRQRPDMAFTRFLTLALRNQPLSIYGDGCQVREFTYVDDIVAGTVAAAHFGRPGSVYNIGGGKPVALIDAVRTIEEVLGRPIALEWREAQIGEARQTGCDGSLAHRELGFEAETGLREGLIRQLDWAVRAGLAEERIARSYLHSLRRTSALAMRWIAA
jgi:nucleoside-diphosphate-sugar epimerase